MISRPALWFLALVVGILPGCTPQAEREPESAPQPALRSSPGEGFLRLVVPPVPVSTDPREGGHPLELRLWDQFFPSLIRLEPREADLPRVTTDLAETYHWAPETRELTVRLRADRVWEDSTRIDVADVTASFEVYRRTGRLPVSPGGESRLRDVQPVDERTVRIRFGTRVALWTALEIASLPVLPTSLLSEEIGRPRSVELSADVGTRVPSGGPFSHPQSLPDGGLELRPNPLAPPEIALQLKGVRIDPCPGEKARVLRVLYGGADIALDVPLYDLGSLLGGAEGFRVQDAGVGSVEMIVWNATLLGPDLSVRQAVSLAVDRDRLARTLELNGEAHGTAALSCWGSRTDVGPAGGDPAQAAEILVATRSAADGVISVPLFYDRGSRLRERLVALIEEDLSRIGVKLEPVALDREELMDRFLRGDFRAALLGFRPPISPDLSDLWASWGRWNGGRFRSAAVDSLVRLQLSTDSTEEILRLAGLIEDRAREEGAVTFLIRRRRVDLVADRVSRFTGSVWRPLGDLRHCTVGPMRAPPRLRVPR